MSNHEVVKSSPTLPVVVQRQMSAMLGGGAPEFVVSQVRPGARPLECHLNVMRATEAGGRQVFGWALDTSVGGYSWAFHSVLEREDGTLCCVTPDVECGKQRPGHVIFWRDPHRCFDLKHFSGFNNLRMFADDLSARRASRAYGQKLRACQIYWEAEGIFETTSPRYDGRYQNLLPVDLVNVLSERFGVDLDGDFLAIPGGLRKQMALRYALPLPTELLRQLVLAA